jgi:hypothetical protein
MSGEVKARLTIGQEGAGSSIPLVVHLCASLGFLLVRLIRAMELNV